MIYIVNTHIALEELKNMAAAWYGQLVKAVVDVEKAVMAINGELHADEEEMLIENGSDQKNLWGINIHPYEGREKRVEFDSMINVRPSQHNMSRSVEDNSLQKKIINIVNQLIKE